MHKYVLAGIIAALVWSCGCGGVSGISRPTTPPQQPGNPAPQAAEYLFVTHGTDTAISAFRVDENTGALTEISGSPFAADQTATGAQALCQSGGTCDSIPRPAVADPSGRFLYVVAPNSNGVRAFQINGATGALTAVSPVAFDTGGSPQDVRMDAAGHFVFVDSDSPPAVTAFSVDPNTGSLRSVANSPFATAELPFLTTATTCCLYLSSTDNPGGVMGYRIDPSSGALTKIAGSPFAPGQSTVALAADATGSYVLAVNDTQNVLVTLKADSSTGALTASGTPVGVGDNPVMVSVSPQEFVYVSTGQGIDGFALNAMTGSVTPIAGTPLPTGAGAIVVEGTGKFTFAVDATNNTIVSFAIQPSGALKQVSVSAPGSVDYSDLAVSMSK